MNMKDISTTKLIVSDKIVSTYREMRNGKQYI